MKISKKTILLLATFGLLLGGIVLAGSSTSYTATKSSTVDVTSYDGVDYTINNTSGSKDYFVPNNSKAEWDAFKAAADSYLPDLTVTIKK